MDFPSSLQTNGMREIDSNDEFGENKINRTTVRSCNKFISILLQLNHFNSFYPQQSSSQSKLNMQYLLPLLAIAGAMLI